MKINTIDILQVRNMAIPTVGKGKSRKKLPLPDHGISTIVTVTARNGENQRTSGLGEIRALPYLTGESPQGGYNFAQKLGQALIGAELPDGVEGWAAAEATAALVDDTTREIMGIAKNDPLPERNNHAAVRFAFDAALLDIMARTAGKSVVALLGADPAPVRRNTFARSFSKPSLLLNSLLKGNMPHGWLRGNFAKNGATLATVTSAIAAATNGKEADLQGVWFGLKGRWATQDIQMLLEVLSVSTPLRGSSLSMILEQPFKSHASAWYKDLFAQLAGDVSPLAGKIRVMIEEDAHSIAALGRIRDLLPHVDLKITPQKCGSFIALRDTLAQAREMGFAGKLYLGNAGMNTELNSIALVTLAQVLGGDLLLSANYKPIDEIGIRQVHPQVTVDEDDTCLLSAPDSVGWGTELCQSLLKKRLRKCDFLRDPDVTPDRDSLKVLLIQRALDDSKIDTRQLDFGDDEEEGDLLDLGNDEAHDESDASEETGDDTAT